MDAASATSRAVRDHKSVRAVFWTRQGIALVTLIILALGLLSIWFNDPSRLASVMGLITAGIAVALQRVITAVAGYFVILRGRTFTIGDRITMGGVRGDVIALGFIQTTIMEMGQPPGEQSHAPAMWVHGRQYTGRVVTITNEKIFDTPVYNYTREFPYIWDEMKIPIPYKADYKQVEKILLQIAERHTLDISKLGAEDLKELEQRYFMQRSDLSPKVYHRLTDNWFEQTLRFLMPAAGARRVKDAMSRDVLDALADTGIDIASGTYDIVGLPPLRVELYDKVARGGQLSPAGTK